LWSIFVPADLANKDVLVCELWEKGTSGIIEEPSGLRAFFEDAIEPGRVGALAAGARISEEIHLPPVADDEPDPILVGTRWFVCSAGNSAAVPAGRIRLEIADTTAFGTGRHESTQLCLEALENYPVAGRVVVDVGCGSGILSSAARFLRAAQVVSCDTHHDAIGATRQQIDSSLFQGSADALPDRCADLVLANISASVLDALASDLKRITKPEGRLIVSGFIRKKLPRAFVAAESFERGGWLCWICHPEAIVPSIMGTGGLSHRTDWWI
jgi:SAM-dependent methyltransferase